MILQGFVRSSRQARTAPVSLSASGPLSTVEEGLTPASSRQASLSSAAGLGTIGVGDGANAGTAGGSTIPYPRANERVGNPPVVRVARSLVR